MILIQEALTSRFPTNQIISIEALNVGPFSQGWLVEVKLGRGNERWFLKQHRKQTQDRLEFELELAELLRKSGMTVIPRTIPTTDGSLWFQAGQHRYSALRYIEGTLSGDGVTAGLASDDCAYLAGGALADLHKYCLELEVLLPAGWRKLAMPWLPQLEGFWQQALSDAEEKLEALDPVFLMVQADKQWIKENLKACLNALPPEGDYALLNHGDYHPGNVLFQGDRVSAILDFEYVHLTHPALDAAYGSYMFSRLKGSGDRENALSAPVIRGYNAQAAQHKGQIRPLDDAELLERYMRIPPFLVAYWLLEQYVQYPEFRDIVLPALQMTLQDAHAIVENKAARL